MSVQGFIPVSFEEYQYDLTIASHLDPLSVAENLCRQNDSEDFWLYNSDTSTSLAIGSIGKITAANNQIEASWNGEMLSNEVLTDPFKQTMDLLDSLPIKDWRAFGHIAFDTAGYYYPYPLRGPSSLINFVVPKTLIEFQPLTTNIKTFGDPGIIISNLIRGESSLHGVPNVSVPHNADRDSYLESVDEIMQEIRVGHLSKAILARCVHLPGSLDVFSTFKAIRHANPAARTYGFRQGDLSGVGSSPELLIKTSPDGMILTNPLAGTRPRGNSNKEDATMRKELATNAKEIKEHTMSVRLAEEELKRICELGSVSVKEFMREVPFRTVWHLSSSVTGRLAKDKTVWDGLRELFPGVTVSGIDKRTAIEKIASLEKEARGPYAGCVGWLDSHGASDLAIALRSAFEDRNGVSISAGAGIIAESIPEREYEETVNKMRTIQEQLVLSH